MTEYHVLILYTAATAALLQCFVRVVIGGAGSVTLRGVLTTSTVASVVAALLLLWAGPFIAVVSVVCLTSLQMAAICAMVWWIDLNIWTIALRVCFLIHTAVLCIGYVAPRL